MIPDHLIDQAAAAIYASTAFGDKFALDAWHDMDDGNPFKVRTRELATAALEAVAANIWDEGQKAGMHDGLRVGEIIIGTEPGPPPGPTPNPYRASETA